MAILPPYLKHGDCIGLVCPAGYMPAEKAQTCLNVLEQWGFNVKVGSTLGRQHDYFSGTDDERLEDLQRMFDDPEVRAVLCGRGGYGLTRIIDRINFKKFLRNPKWLIGFSDVTVLHAHLYRRLDIASLHAPMAAAFNNEQYKNDYVESLRLALSGLKADYVVPSHPFSQLGSATGELVGGNLSLLCHLLGTPSEFKTRSRILFIEDVGEYIYNVDRMMYQLKRAGKLNKLAGLIVGGFTDMKDTTIPFGKSVYETISDIVREYNYPVGFGFPVSHEKENYALKVGVEYKLIVGRKKIRLKEK